MTTMALSDQDVILITILVTACTFSLILKASSAVREKFDNSNRVSNEFLSQGLDTGLVSNGLLVDIDPLRTVLVVDDDPVTRRHLRMHLEKLKFVVVEVSDGPSAVRLYEDGKRFCLILMDYEMPDMNGLGATKMVRAYDNDVVIVGFTIHDPATKQDEFLAAGANLVDMKPISAERLKEYVDEYNLLPK